MKKAIFVLGSLELDGVRQGKPLTTRTLKALQELADGAELDADLVFATQDEYMAGRDRHKIGMAHIREERLRVLDEISQAKPDLVICFGPVAAASVWGQGNLKEDALLRKEHRPLKNGPPVFYTFSLENLRARPGLRQWLELDLHAACNGMTDTTLGDYTVLLPDDIDWNYDPLVDLKPGDTVGFDTETYPGLDYYRDDARIRMCQITDKVGRSWVIQCTPASGMPGWLGNILESPDIRKVGSNIKYDYKWLRRFGVRMRNMEDTSTREHIIDQSNPRKDLKSLTFKYLPRLSDYARPHRELVKERGGWEHVEDDEQYEYAAADAEASLAAWEGQQEDLKPLERPRKLFHELYQVLAEMEFQGVTIDVDTNRALDQLYKEHLRKLSSKIVEVLGPINLNSPTQLARALGEAVPGIDLSFYDIRRAMGTDDTEETSTKREVLEREAHKHPIIEIVLTYRKYRVRYSTFVDKMYENNISYHHKHAFLHGSFRTDLVETYRTSSSSPNTMNIPVKDDDNPHLSVKKQFVSRFKGGSILDADQSQIELRFAAWASGDVNMIAAIRSGEDIHTAMASRLLGKPAEEITERERYECKERTFLIMYGGGAKKLAGSLGVSREKAMHMIREYFETFSGLKRYIDSMHAIVKRDLEVTTHFGFKRRFAPPNRWNSGDGFRVMRQAFNTMIQNGAACLMYCGLIAVHNALESRNLQSKLVLQVHDSMVLDVYPGEEEEVAEICKTGMEIATLEKAKQFGVDFTVPLEADSKIGPNWAEVA